MQTIPVVIFAYARPQHLTKTLATLRANAVPLLYAFSDGPGRPDLIPTVHEVREVLRAIDWCDVVLTERETNLGLGKSIITGVSEVFERHDAVIVFEDDLVCVPGTYAYLSAALRHYASFPQVMSVTGWTHPLVIPSDVGSQPYFDGRSECWAWGAWRRSWTDMDKTALAIMANCRAKGIDVYRYGHDLEVMAKQEMSQNIWAVRFLYAHMLREGLCLRPPHSLVEHIGWDAEATNATEAEFWANPPLKPCPAVPDRWPDPVEHPECSIRWRAVCGRPSLVRRVVRKIRTIMGAIARMFWPTFAGDSGKGAA